MTLPHEPALDAAARDERHPSVLTARADAAGADDGLVSVDEALFYCELGKAVTCSDVEAAVTLVSDHLAAAQEELALLRRENRKLGDTEKASEDAQEQLAAIQAAYDKLEAASAVGLMGTVAEYEKKLAAAEQKIRKRDAEIVRLREALNSIALQSEQVASDKNVANRGFWLGCAEDAREALNSTPAKGTNL